MKLRIRGNSLRLRLGQSEVRRLLDVGAVEESTEFGPPGEQPFSYAIHLAADERNVLARFAEGKIVVLVPRETARAWGESEQVGIEAEQPLAAGKSLKILVEKDFECLDRAVPEPQDDAFPHPQRDTACKPAGAAPPNRPWASSQQHP
jgi:hypothetical protein